MGIALLFIYTVLIFIAAKQGLTTKDADSFFVNGRKSGAFAVGASIVASCVGASATLGMIGLAFNIGTPAFWWLGMGAVGLSFLAIFLATAVRDSGAYTMPQLVQGLLDTRSKNLISLIIVLAWLAILAAQFTAASKIIQGLTNFSPTWCAGIGFFLIVAHTLAGQAAVMRTDKVQTIILICTLGILLLWLSNYNPDWISSVKLEAVNEDFPPSRLFYYFLVIGANYLVCPMLFSRILSAKDTQSARKGTFMAAAGLIFCALIITAIGLACIGILPQGTKADSVLTLALPAILPEWLHMLALIALISAIVSSADSCLFTAASIICNDLVKKDTLSVRRLSIALFAAVALLLSLSSKGILDFLLMAYDVYACGVVAPVFIAIVMRKRKRIHPRFACTAILLGGICGLLAAFLELPYMSYAGIAVSAAITLAGARVK